MSRSEISFLVSLFSMTSGFGAAWTLYAVYEFFWTAFVFLEHVGGMPAFAVDFYLKCVIIELRWFDTYFDFLSLSRRDGHQYELQSVCLTDRGII